MPGAEPDLITRWATSGVPQAQRLDYWAASLTDALIPLGLDNADPRTFRSEMSHAAFGPIHIVRQSGSSHRCFRTRSELARSAEHSFNLVMAVNCPWRIDHLGQSAMSAGDVLLADSSHPISMRIDREYDIVNLGFSEEWLRRWLPDPHRLIARRIPGNSPWGRALAAYLRELSPELAAEPPLPLPVIADQVGSLMALTAIAAGNAPAIASTPAARSLYLRIQDCLMQRCVEPHVTAVDVAASANTSVRTLHRVLATANETFAGALVVARARVATRMLMSPLFNRLTTAEIGRRAGFPSASHFARVMRAHTGRTPLHLRRDAHSENVERDRASNHGADERD